MICTNKAYDKLLNFYYKNKNKLESVNRDYDVLYCLFLLKNIESKKEFITDIEVNVEKKVLYDIFDNEYNSHWDEEIVLFYTLQEDGIEYDIPLYLKYELHNIDSVCTCTPNMEGYYEEYGCCGKTCSCKEPYFMNHEGVEYRVPNYQEYMYFDFLRDIEMSEKVYRELESNVEKQISELEKNIEFLKSQIVENMVKLRKLK